jgi:hypothetical protein
LVFKDQLYEGEFIVTTIRKHWNAYLGIFFKTVLLKIVLVAAVIMYFAKTFVESGLFFQIVLLFSMLYILGMWFWAFAQWIDEEFDCMVVTDRRLLDITQTGLFKISQSETNLSQIQDVKGSINGFWNNIFKTGDIEIQTAARDIGFQMGFVYQPKKVSHDILERRDIRLKQIHAKKAFEESGGNPMVDVDVAAN